MFVRIFKKKTKKILIKYFPHMYEKYDNKRFTKKTVEKYSRENDKNVFNIYTLGAIDNRKESDYSNLKELIEPSDFCYAYLNEYNQQNIIKLKEAGVKAFCVSKNVRIQNDTKICVKEDSYNIFKCKNIKIGIINFNSKNDKNVLYEMINEIKQKKVNYLVAYIVYEDLTQEVQSLIIKAARKTNQAIGISNKQKIPHDISKKTRKAMFSIGSLISNKYENDEEKKCIILKNVIKTYNNQIINLEKSYIPLVFDEEKNIVRKLDIRDKKDMSIYRSLNKGINNIVDEKRILNIRNLFEIFDIEMPNKYKDLQSIVVRNICVFPFEIDKCSVLFVREYNSVVHEGTEEEYYKRLIVKLRKNARKGLLLVFSPIDLPDDIPYIKVESSMSLHAKICKYIIDSCEFNIKVAVTGSTGKTSTKEMIALVLAEKYDTIKNNGNENLQIKMGLMLKELSPRYEAYVQEVGGGKMGGASSFSNIMTPDIGVVTNIGYSHLRWSKTREQLAINKVGIGDGIRNNGPLFINLDNDMLQQVDVKNRNIITYAIDNKTADYTAENIVVEETKILFDIVHKGQSTSCIINTPGKYNIYNALVAFGIGQYVGMKEDEICRGIAKFKPEGIRQTLMQIGGYNLFVDCYNAAPNSMIGAVETLSQIGDKNGKKIAILADMTGMEELSEKLHKEVGEKISSCDIDYLICYGSDIKHVYDNFTNSKTNKLFFENKKDVIKAVKKIAKPGDYILFKGSSKFKLEEDIIDEWLGTNLSTIGHERKKKDIIKKAKGNYQMFPHCVHIVSTKTTSTPVMLSKIKNKKVISIAKGAFEGNVFIKSIELSENLKSIQENAFKNCTKLTQVQLPKTLQIIENNAFENCISLTEINVNDNLIHIGEEAFKNCRTMNKIRLHEKIQFIGENAFEGCKNIKIICHKRSYADEYAKKNKIKTKYY